MGKDQIEKWKEIDGATGYEISSFGRVRSWKWPVRKPKNQWIVRKHLGFRILSHDIRNGYPSVRIAYDNDGLKWAAIHVLVLEAFVGERPEKHQGAHYDGCKTNNLLSNLRWATPKDNNEDKLRHGTQKFGHLAVSAKLNPKQVKEIRKLRKDGTKVCDLAKEYGVCRNTITSLTTGRTYTNI
jgi:hypothetical protein